MTLRIMLVTRNVVSFRAIVLDCPFWISEIASTSVDPGDRLKRTRRPAVWKERVRAGDLQRRRFEHSERDRWIGARRGADADAAPQAGHLVVAGGLGDLDGGDVPGERQRAPQRDRAFVLTIVVAGGPR